MINDKEPIILYKNYPKLENDLSTDELLVILGKVNSWTSGKASIVGLCENCVYYFTQCPSKYVMSTITSEYALEIKPVGNYYGLFNVYQAERVEVIESSLYNMMYQESIDNKASTALLDFINNGYNDGSLELEIFAREVALKTKRLGFSFAYVDNCYFNFCLVNGQIKWIDPVLVQ